MKFYHRTSRRALALLLSLTLCVSMIPCALAAQVNSYHDPADHWLASNNRTNELDANATVTHETFYCDECKQEAGFEVWRTPEYTKDGQTAIKRSIRYSDGTMLDGEGKGAILDGTPGVDGYYTGYHFTKAVCERCGTINANLGMGDYGFGNNVYWLYDCAAEFQQKLDDTVTYAYTDSTYHTKTTTGGTYCGFCYGTHHTKQSVLERHSLKTTVTPELGHQRFAVKDACTLCDYEKVRYVAAKSVISNYYGVVDELPHTLTVTDLSESGVTTSIRYGNSADSCTMTSAPNYTEEGQYTVYYAITYTYGGISMTENGVAYVWLWDEHSPSNPCKNHSFAYLDTVRPGCLTLGYDRYLCTKCGQVDKRNYVNAVGHNHQGVVIREAFCEIDGKVLEICSRCGDTRVTSIPKGEHTYETYSVEPTCVSPGYKVKECAVCGDRHITDITDALPHDYKAHVTPATCKAGGSTLHLCDGCGSSFVTDYTEALGHSWNKGTVVTKPTCTGEGVTEYRCTRCDYHRLEGMEATGHIPGDPATCTENQTCTSCGAVLSTATGHKPSDWIIDKEPTTEDEGQRHKECENCGETLETETMEKLTALTERHGAYIVGYPDDTFGPEQSMTRGEAAAIFARLLANQNGDTISAARTGFTDVPKEAWYSGYVKYLAGYDIVQGRENSSFKPDKAITRAEYVTMAVRFFAVYGDGDAELMEKYARFNDVADGYWAAKYIQDAAIRGWINGYGDSTFRGDTEITRAEVVAITNRLLGRTADKDYIGKYIRRINTFTDLSEEHWAYYDVLEAANGHTTKRHDDGESWNIK